MKKVVFDPDGGPLVAEVQSGFAQPGSYTVYLWEAHANKVLMKARGNFINTDDDAYKLPRPNIQNEDRLVECIATVSITPPLRDYNLRLSIMQDGREIGFDEATGKAADPTATADLFVQLESSQ
jgi:hypothetical protein